jgi:hypothetical protein
MKPINHKSSDDDIRKFVQEQERIYPKHLVQLAYCVRPDQPDMAEVDTTVRGWPVRRFKYSIMGEEK